MRFPRSGSTNSSTHTREDCSVKEINLSSLGFSIMSAGQFAERRSGGVGVAGAMAVVAAAR